MTTTQTAPAPRKWDAEIITARQHDAWIQFETDIHQSAALRARVARALDRYGLGTSDIAVEEALDYIILTIAAIAVALALFALE